MCKVDDLDESDFEDMENDDDIVEDKIIMVKMRWKMMKL